MVSSHIPDGRHAHIVRSFIDRVVSPARVPRTLLSSTVMLVRQATESKSWLSLRVLYSAQRGW